MVLLPLLEIFILTSIIIEFIPFYIYEDLYKTGIM